MNRKQFTAKAEQMFRRANPSATIGRWTFGPNRVTWADGSKGYSGAFLATAPGYLTSQILATQSRDGVWVR
jgi:hypothetical protein